MNVNEKISSQIPNEQWLDHEILFKDNNDIPAGQETLPRPGTTINQHNSDGALLKTSKHKTGDQMAEQKLLGLKTQKKPSSVNKQKKLDLKKEKAMSSSKSQYQQHRRYSIEAPKKKDSNYDFLVNQYSNIQAKEGKNYNFSNHR